MTQKPAHPSSDVAMIEVQSAAAVRRAPTDRACAVGFTLNGVQLFSGETVLPYRLPSTFETQDVDASTGPSGHVPLVNARFTLFDQSVAGVFGPMKARPGLDFVAAGASLLRRSVIGIGRSLLTSRSVPFVPAVMLGAHSASEMLAKARRLPIDRDGACHVAILSVIVMYDRATKAAARKGLAA